MHCFGHRHAEHDPGFFVGFAHRGERKRGRFREARPPHARHQLSRVLFVQRCRSRDQAIGGFNAAPRKHEFAGQKAMTLVPAAQQNLRHFAGAIDQDQCCGIARFEIWKRLIAHAARKPLGAIRRTSAGADAQIVVH